MPLRYNAPPDSGPLRQGELLRDIWEHRPILTPTSPSEKRRIEVFSVHRPLMIVMTEDCDLAQDFHARFPDPQALDQYQAAIQEENHPALVLHILLCDVYEMGQIKPRIPGSDIWKRIQQNQDERYHHFGPAEIGNPPVGNLPDLYLDFKKVLALPTQNLYEGLRTKEVTRRAIVPPVYLHDLLHRFYGFLSRVSLPN